MSEKNKILEYIDNPITTSARNRMGCSENWYNCYYAMSKTFSHEEIENMSDQEIDLCLRIAEEIQEALY